MKTFTINPCRPSAIVISPFLTNGKWRNFPNDDARARDNFLRRITFAHQPAEIIAGSERFAQKMECFCLERLEQFLRHPAHVLKHTGAMPADYASILWVGLTDLEFPRHERKDLSRQPPLQAKTARFGAVISIETARKVLVHATMADLETQIQKLSAAIAGLESQRKTLGEAVIDPAIAALREQLIHCRKIC